MSSRLISFLFLETGTDINRKTKISIAHLFVNLGMFMGSLFPQVCCYKLSFAKNF